MSHLVVPADRPPAARRVAALVGPFFLMVMASLVMFSPAGIRAAAQRGEVVSTTPVASLTAAEVAASLQEIGLDA